MRSCLNPELVYEIREDIAIGQLASDGGQLRPDIVWFGEPVPRIEEAADIVSEADLFVIIGTSLQVYPAAGLIHLLKNPDIPVFVIDRDIPAVVRQKQFTTISKTAVAGVAELLTLLC